MENFSIDKWTQMYLLYLKDSDTSESFIVFLLSVLSLILLLFSFPQTPLPAISSKTITLTASKLHTQVDPCLILCKVYFSS